MAFQIDKGVPIPEPKGSFSRTLRRMKIGDSIFLVPADLNVATNILLAGRISGVANLAWRRYGLKYVQRRQDDGIRVWRVE